MWSHVASNEPAREHRFDPTPRSTLRRAVAVRGCSSDRRVPLHDLPPRAGGPCRAAGEDLRADSVIHRVRRVPGRSPLRGGASRQRPRRPGSWQRAQFLAIRWRYSGGRARQRRPSHDAIPDEGPGERFQQVYAEVGRGPRETAKVPAPSVRPEGGVGKQHPAWLITTRPLVQVQPPLLDRSTWTAARQGRPGARDRTGDASRVHVRKPPRTPRLRLASAGRLAIASPVDGRVETREAASGPSLADTATPDARERPGPLGVPGWSTAPDRSPTAAGPDSTGQDLFLPSILASVPNRRGDLNANAGANRWRRTRRRQDTGGRR